MDMDIINFIWYIMPRIFGGVRRERNLAMNLLARVFLVTACTFPLALAPAQAQKSKAVTAVVQQYEVCRGGDFLRVKADKNLLVINFFGDNEIGGVDFVLGRRMGRPTRNTDGCLAYEFVPIPRSGQLSVGEKINDMFGCSEYHDSCQWVVFWGPAYGHSDQAVRHHVYYPDQPMAGIKIKLPNGKAGANQYWHLMVGR